MKFYYQVLTCANCHYTRDNSEWYISPESGAFYCLKVCYEAKEKQGDAED